MTYFCIMKRWTGINSVVHLVILLGCCLFNRITAQEKNTFKYAIELSTDNDALAIWENLDRYYTFGIGAKFYFRSDSFLGLERILSKKKNYFFDVELRSEGYTPTEKSYPEEEVLDEDFQFERPFAGLLFGVLGANYTFDRYYLRSELLLGVMGPASGAAEIQNWIHAKLPTSGLVEGWKYQLPNQLIANFNLKLTYDLTPNASLVDVFAASEARLGNLYIDFTPTIGVRIGKFNAIATSTGFNNDILAEIPLREIYFMSSVSGTIAAYNATAQGNIFGPKYEYASDSISNFHSTITNGVYISGKRYGISFKHIITHGKVVPNERHMYGILGLRYRF